MNMETKSSVSLAYIMGRNSRAVVKRWDFARGVSGSSLNLVHCGLEQVTVPQLLR